MHMSSLRISPKYLVDESGKRQSVQLTLAEYKRLLRRLEDLEDTLALDEARRTATGFVDYEVERTQLRKAGKL